MASLCAVAAAALPVEARADALQANATLGVAHAVGQPQGREFGLGATGALSLALPLGRALAVELKATGLVLAQGNPPKDPRITPQATGTATLGTLGLRVRPFTAIAGPWASLGAGVVETGNRTRLGIDAALGWDFRLSHEARWDVGPYVGFIDVVQPDGSLRPNDAYVFSAGIHLGLGAPEERRPPPDRDSDGVVDAVDACPDLPGVETNDPTTNGCAPDRDRDGIHDAADACPDVPGVRTDDPKTNGCPSDRDQDGIYDAEDACPTVRGVKTADPKTNGCPPDRDKDGVPDADDACPDVIGIKTDDPKTNGCPLAGTNIRVEGEKILLDDVILFDLDSPRVRHASWGTIQRLADFINKNPDILEVIIEGHADATGTEQHNLLLSRQRAESVRTLLVQGGVDPDRVKAEAFGRTRLKVATQRAEAANRRVEFWITRTSSSRSQP